MEDHVNSASSDSPNVFDVSESLIPAREVKGVGQCSISFDGLLGDPLLLKEDLAKGCGGQLWPAGMVLAKYLLRQSHSDLADKTMSVTTYLIIVNNW